MALISTAPVVAAEPMFKLGQELPPMLVRVCPTLADAKSDSDLARQLALEPYRKGAFSTLRHPNCKFMDLAVIPMREEFSIQASNVWALAHDPSSSDYVSDRDGKSRIPVSARRSATRYYLAKYTANGADWYQGWVELPDEPYVLKYLEHRQRAR